MAVVRDSSTLLGMTLEREGVGVPVGNMTDGTDLRSQPDGRDG